MKAKLSLVVFLIFSFAGQTIFAQTVPTQIKRFLDRNYKGWKLQKDKCYPDSPGKAVVKGNFNGDKKPDYAVKFVRGKKGFIIAFLAQGQNYKPFVLHNTGVKDVQTLSLDIWTDNSYELGGNNVRLKWDAISDFRCESDVGGIHYYRNGKFIAY
jgi:hypothetical protein